MLETLDSNIALMTAITSPAYIGRFAPTPSGHLHFGSLVAALASYLDARSVGGRWLMRMEDLDPPREEPGAQAAILKALESYGFEWDGEMVRQSDRHDAYAEVLNRLFNHGLAYACTCSRKQLAAVSRHLSGPVPQRRPRHRRRGDPPARAGAGIPLHRPGAGRVPPAPGPRGRRFRDPPPRRALRLSTGGGAGRCLARHHRYRPRRRPAGLHAAPALPARTARPAATALPAHPADYPAGRQQARQVLPFAAADRRSGDAACCCVRCAHSGKTRAPNWLTPHHGKC